MQELGCSLLVQHAGLRKQAPGKAGKLTAHSHEFLHWGLSLSNVEWGEADTFMGLSVYLKSNSCEILLRAFSDPALQS